MPRMTVRDLVTMAMKELKVIAPGTEPDASELADGAQMLMSMLRSWSTQSNMWRDEAIEVTFVALNDAAVLPATVRTVISARVIEPGYDRPLAIWDVDDFRDIPNRAQRGRPVAVAVFRGRDAVTLRVWPVPPVDVTVRADVQRQFEEPADATDSPDVPIEWEEAVWTNLAVRMSNMFGSGAELTPELVNRAQSTLAALLDDDRPESYYMMSDRHA